LTAVFWHPHYNLDISLPGWLTKLASRLVPTPFHKYKRLHTALSARRGFVFKTPEVASRALLGTVHTEDYLEGLEAHAREGALRASWRIHRGDSDVLDSDCAPFNRHVLDFFKASVGGTCAALQHAYETKAVAINLSGGFHHAAPAEGAGFCILNDVAVAVRRLNKKVLIVDLDVHHGDGNVVALRDNPKAFTFSMHQREGYPEVKPRGSYDVGLREGAEDAEYLQALLTWLPGCLDAFKPAAVVYLAGVDPLETDKLGGLSLSTEGLQRRDQLVFELCRARSLPVAVVLGGGYSPLEITVQAHLITCEEARRVSL